MIDVQNSHDVRQIAIDEVGVCDFFYPITVLGRNGRVQETIGRFSMSVNLAKNVKGTHLSRFIDLLHKHRNEVSTRTLLLLLKETRRNLEADMARIEVSFTFFIERQAPISNAGAFMNYECTLIGEVNDESEKLFLRVCVPVTSVCPCSKAISDYGAHNQRGIITIEASINPQRENSLENVWPEELIEIAESSASAPLYALLKRVDERQVTMQAYDNPVFVEDMIRNVTLRLEKDHRIHWFKAQAVNYESIHNHNAFARVERLNG